MVDLHPVNHKSHRNNYRNNYIILRLDTRGSADVLRKKLLARELAGAGLVTSTNQSESNDEA